MGRRSKKRSRAEALEEESDEEDGPPEPATAIVRLAAEQNERYKPYTIDWTRKLVSNRNTQSTYQYLSCLIISRSLTYRS